MIVHLPFVGKKEKGQWQKKKPNNITKSDERRISKARKKPLSSNGKNNGPQAYKIVEKAPNKTNEPKGAQRRK